MFLEELNKMWTVISVILTCCIAYQIKTVIRFLEDAKIHNFPSNSLSDMSEMLVYLFFLAIFRLGMDKAIRNWVRQRLSKIDGDKLTEVKFEKSVRQCVSLLWYTFATIYGYVLLKDHEYVPKQFLGSCSCQYLLSEWPYYKSEGNIRTFFMVMLSHHFFSLLELYWSSRKRPDAAEMYLHHVATVSLMLFSYYTNMIPGGLTLLIAHNVGDMMLNVTKVLRDLRLTTNPYLVGLSFITMFFSWFIPRVWLILTCLGPVSLDYIYRNLINDVRDYEMDRWFLFDRYFGVLLLQAIMILIIIVLNTYWSLIILSLLYKTVVNKKIDAKIKGGEGY